MGAIPLDQGVRCRGAGALRCLACFDALGRREIPLVGDAQLAAALGSLGSRALVLHHVLDAPGERVLCPGGETARGAGPEPGEHRPVPLREAPYVCEHL